MVNGVTTSQWLFNLTIVLYLASAVAYVWNFYFRKGERVSTVLAVATWVTHTATLLLTVAELRRPPLYTTHEAVLFLTWVIFLNYILVEFLFRLKAVGAFLVPVVFLFLVYAAALPRGVEPGQVGAPNNWIALHAIVALAGYGAFALAFVASVMYLLQERQLRFKAFKLFYHRLPSLQTLDVMAHRLVTFGFPMLTLAIITGSAWARESWGASWFWEPKGIWSLVTWAIYALYLSARAWGGWRGRKSAYLIVAGFMAVLFNLLVVNLVISDKHVF